MQKKDCRTILELFCAKKGLQKTANIQKMTTFPKSAKLVTMQRPMIAFAKWSVGSKIKILKNMRKATLQPN